MAGVGGTSCLKLVHAADRETLGRTHLRFRAGSGIPTAAALRDDFDDARHSNLRSWLVIAQP